MRTEAVLTVDTEPSISGDYVVAERFAPLLHQPVAGAVDGNPLPALLRASETSLDDRLP